MPRRAGAKTQQVANQESARMSQEGTESESALEKTMTALEKSEKERFEELVRWRNEKEGEFERVVKWIYQEFGLLTEFGCAKDIRKGDRGDEDTVQVCVFQTF